MQCRPNDPSGREYVNEMSVEWQSKAQRVDTGDCPRTILVSASHHLHVRLLWHRVFNGVLDAVDVRTLSPLPNRQVRRHNPIFYLQYANNHFKKIKSSIFN